MLKRFNLDDERWQPHDVARATCALSGALPVHHGDGGCHCQDKFVYIQKPVFSGTLANHSPPSRVATLTALRQERFNFFLVSNIRITMNFVVSLSQLVRDRSSTWFALEEERTQDPRSTPKRMEILDTFPRVKVLPPPATRVKPLQLAGVACALIWLVIVPFGIGCGSSDEGWGVSTTKLGTSTKTTDWGYAYVCTEGGSCVEYRKADDGVNMDIRDDAGATAAFTWLTFIFGLPLVISGAMVGLAGLAPPAYRLRLGVFGDMLTGSTHVAESGARLNFGCKMVNVLLAVVTSFCTLIAWAAWVSAENKIKSEVVDTFAIDYEHAYGAAFVFMVLAWIFSLGIIGCFTASIFVIDQPPVEVDDTVAADAPGHAPSVI